MRYYLLPLLWRRGFEFDFEKDEPQEHREDHWDLSKNYGPEREMEPELIDPKIIACKTAILRCRAAKEALNGKVWANGNVPLVKRKPLDPKTTLWLQEVTTDMRLRPKKKYKSGLYQYF